MPDIKLSKLFAAPGATGAGTVFMEYDAMSIDALSTHGMAALFHQKRLDMKTLASAVRAGDVTAAQAALQSYQKDVQAIWSQIGPTGSDGSRPAGPKITTDFSNLATAVQAGNMTDANAALSAYRSGHRDHVQKPVDASANSSFSTDLTNFLAAAQTGDSGQVQAAAAALAHDLQGLVQAGGLRGHHHHEHGDRDDQPAQVALTPGDGADPAGAAPAAAPTSDPITADLLNIAAALKGNDATALQSASAMLNAHLQGLASSDRSNASGTKHHHHHDHHHGNGSRSVTTAPAPSIPGDVASPPAAIP